MGYNEHCLYQNCSWKCCNYHGDCPEWYSNGNEEVDPSTLIATAVGTAIGVIVIAIIACVWYKMYKKKQQELKGQNEFQISHANLQTKADVVVANSYDMIAANRSQKPPVSQQQNQKSYKNSPAGPYNLPFNGTVKKASNQIYGIGPQYQKSL